MAPLTPHNHQPPDKRPYYVIGKCDALKAPAIFLDWEDCSFYVDQNENDCQVQVQSFDQIMDAIGYLTDQLAKRTNIKVAAAATPDYPPPHVLFHDTSKRPAEIDTLLASASAQIAKRPRMEPANMAPENSPFGRKFTMLQEYQKVYGTLKVETKHCRDQFSGLNDFMIAWKKKQRNFSEGPPCKKSDKALARIQQLQHLGVEFPSNKSRSTVPEPATVLVSTTPAAAATRNPIIVTDLSPFGRKFTMLKKYQQVFGTLDVKTKHCRDQFYGLNEFMASWKKTHQSFTEGPPCQKSDKAVAHIQQLLDLGVEFPSNKTRWEGKFKELQRYKAFYGKVSTSHGHPLRSWCFSQRNHMRQYEEDPKKSRLNQEQYQRLVDLGMKGAKRGEETTMATPAPATPAPTTTTAATTTAAATTAATTTGEATTGEATTGETTTGEATPALETTAFIRTASSWEEMLE